jgi:uroporphyrinogen decarboxylase
MIPQFEEKVLERGERSQIVQDWKGNICEIGNQYTVNYLRDPIDFVTRRWIKCPVESRSDWQAMQRRYDPDDPARLPPDAATRGAQLRDRETVYTVTFSGPFWQLREWLGFERLCMLFHDDPDWLREMVEFWRVFLARLLENLLQHIVPDMLCISEDMAYKRFPMISPAMAEDFLAPCYRTWGAILRAAGGPIYAVDSDGYIPDLIPVWLDAGVNVCLPIEVAAGNDLPGMRDRFGRRVAFQGGIDKRAIAAGGAAIEAELARLEPVINDGGYLPSCDHGVPANVSWPDYLHYVECLARKTGWL